MISSQLVHLSGLGGPLGNLVGHAREMPIAHDEALAERHAGCVRPRPRRRRTRGKWPRFITVLSSSPSACLRARDAGAQRAPARRPQVLSARLCLRARACVCVCGMCARVWNQKGTPKQERTCHSFIGAECRESIYFSSTSRVLALHERAKSFVSCPGEQRDQFSPKEFECRHVRSHF